MYLFSKFIIILSSMSKTWHTDVSFLFKISSVHAMANDFNTFMIVIISRDPDSKN